jgi:hypothetical protein
MASPQENTKIEQLVDAFEGLALALAESVLLNQSTHPAQDKTPELIAMNRADARNDMANALRAFLKPSLRVMDRTSDYEAEKAALAKSELERSRVLYGGAGIDGMQLG